VLRAARLLWERRLVAGTAGNVSVRAGDRVVITPSRRPYAEMTERDLVSVAVDGGAVRGRAGAAPPSRELPLHLALYRARPDVGAVIHTHSPYATAWSFLDVPLEPRTEDLEYYGVGPVATAAYAPPASDALAAAAVAALGSSRAALLARHGVLVAAGDLAHALSIAEAVEHQAHVAWILRSGGAPPADLHALIDHMVG
jgi:L-fuculose-phosphate aldolase